MRELTARETQLLDRYLRLSRLHDRFDAFWRARRAANALLDAVEATIPKQDPTEHQLTYLQGISRRKARNYRKLRGMRGVLSAVAALRDKTLADLALGGDP